MMHFTVNAVSKSLANFKTSKRTPNIHYFKKSVFCPFSKICKWLTDDMSLFKCRMTFYFLTFINIKCVSIFSFCIKFVCTECYIISNVTSVNNEPRVESKDIPPIEESRSTLKVQVIFVREINHIQVALVCHISHTNKE